ncbi:MAG: hypothetical protein IMZ52_01585 [Actinobacteria bacterium]|nr:hypothetical protein [Actinomycetota bacterium]MBE3114826.1 hypothetical protein [Actinomycetota bacterium]
MNRLIDDMAKQILYEHIETLKDYQIDILLTYLKEKYNFVNPLKMEFPDNTSTDISVETLRNWLKHYKISPTGCESKDEYEKKLLAMRI